MKEKELKEIAKEIPEITGVQGMNKAELLDVIEKAKGAVEAPKKEKAKTPKEKAASPKEKTETPKKKAEAPKEKTETPKEKAEAPKEKTEAPKEKVEAPKEKTAAPKEKAEAPKEKAAAPKEKAKAPKEKLETAKEKEKTPKNIKGVLVKDIKNKIRALKTERKAALEAKDKKMATIYRKRISRLKKKTRRAA